MTVAVCIANELISRRGTVSSEGCHEDEQKNDGVHLSIHCHGDEQENDGVQLSIHCREDEQGDDGVQLSFADSDEMYSLFRLLSSRRGVWAFSLCTSRFAIGTAHLFVSGMFRCVVSPFSASVSNTFIGRCRLVEPVLCEHV